MASAMLGRFGSKLYAQAGLWMLTEDKNGIA